MKIIVVALCVLITSAHSYAQVEWTKFYPISEQAHAAVAFPDTSTIVVMSWSEAAAVSTNSGETWTRNVISAKVKWHDVVSLRDDILVSVGENGMYARSLDKGKSWKIDKTPTDESLLHIWSDGIKTLVASGDSGAILRSTDAGVSWIGLRSPTNSAIPYITNSPTGRLLAFDTAGVITYSDDLGETWSISARDSTWHVFALHMFTKDSGFVAGTYNGIARTADGGKTWYSDTTANFKSWKIPSEARKFTKALVHQEPSGTVSVLFCDGSLYIASRSLNDWSKSKLKPSQYEVNFTDFAIDAQGQYWALHLWEGLYKISFPELATTLVTVPYAVNLDARCGFTPEGICAFYGNLQVVLSLDTGRTWSASKILVENRNAPSSFLPSIQIIDANRLVVSGMSTYPPGPDPIYTHRFEAYESNDNGKTWKIYDLKSIEDEKTYDLDI